MSTSMRKWLVDQWRADQVTRGRCEGRVCEAHLKLTAPCHNCSYLSVGGEWISSMNNRLSLIFLGEPRLPISQLISEFSLLLIYRRILSRDWEWGGRGVRITQSSGPSPLSAEEEPNVEWFSKATKNVNERKNVTYGILQGFSYASTKSSGKSTAELDVAS